MVEADLHDQFGIDCSSGILRDRTWRWLQIRILALLSVDSRLYRHFKPPEQTPSVARRRRR